MPHTDCSAEIDQAKSMQDLDDVGSALGSARMRLETVDSGVAKGSRGDREPFWVREESSGGRRIARKEHLPMLTRRQLAFEIYAFFKIIDVQGQAKNMNDLLNVESMTIPRQSQEVRPSVKRNPNGTGEGN